jgi:hypothetical protein
MSTLAVKIQSFMEALDAEMTKEIVVLRADAERVNILAQERQLQRIRSDVAFHEQQLRLLEDVCQLRTNNGNVNSLHLPMLYLHRC